MNYRTPLIALLIFLYGCGATVATNISRLNGNPTERKAAMIELTMANITDQPAIIAAVKDPAQPVEVRVDLVTVLFRMFLAHGDPGIRTAFGELLNDSQSAVRCAAVKALGDTMQKEAVPLLVTALADKVPEVQLETLNALTKVEQHVSPEDSAQIVEHAAAIVKTKPEGDLKARSMDVLENAADQLASKAEVLALKGDVADAEKELQKLSDTVPESKNIHYKIGRFYYDTDQKEKGIDALAKEGFVLRLKKAALAPVIDGEFTDACWQDAPTIDKFYQCVKSYVAQMSSIKGEIKLAYTDDALFIAYKAFEPSTKGLVRNVKNFDGEVWKDDCIEIFIDSQHNYKSFHQIIINSIGTVQDVFANGKNKDGSWSSKVELKAKIEPSWWALEIKIPIAELKNTSAVKPGTTWGFNVTSTRIGNASEMGQWTPTYGSTGRPERFGFLVFE
jgi:hypothetical protein